MIMHSTHNNSSRNGVFIKTISILNDIKYLIIISISIYWTNIILLVTATAEIMFLQYVASIYLI